MTETDDDRVTGDKHFPGLLIKAQNPLGFCKDVPLQGTDVHSVRDYWQLLAWEVAPSMLFPPAAT